MLKHTTLASGAKYVVIHYTADEDKDSEWARTQSAGVPVREWEREMEMRQDVYDGEAVYADYNDSLHSVERLTCDGGGELVGGWDCGQTLRPAFVLLHVSKDRIQCCLEVVTLTATPMQSFAPLVEKRLEMWALSQGLDLWPGRVRHHGDATVVSRSGSTGESAASVARSFAFAITPVTNDWDARYSAVAWLLSERREGQALFQLCRERCPVLREGLKGAYQFQVPRGSEQIGPGRVLRMPLKNSYSHPQDALQYAAVVAKRIVEGVGVKVGKYR
jgi:hypothetical protein